MLVLSYSEVEKALIARNARLERQAALKQAMYEQSLKRAWDTAVHRPLLIGVRRFFSDIEARAPWWVSAAMFPPISL